MIEHNLFLPKVLSRYIRSPFMESSSTRSEQVRLTSEVSVVPKTRSHNLCSDKDRIFRLFLSQKSPQAKSHPKPAIEAGIFKASIRHSVVRFRMLDQNNVHTPSYFPVEPKPPVRTPSASSPSASKKGAKTACTIRSPASITTVSSVILRI